MEEEAREEKKTSLRRMRCLYSPAFKYSIIWLPIHCASFVWFHKLKAIRLAAVNPITTSRCVTPVTPYGVFESCLIHGVIWSQHTTGEGPFDYCRIRRGSASVEQTRSPHG
jgi:hypothetical protein